METPASVEIISGETVRERGQRTVVEAVTQNATGFSANTKPGNGDNAFSTRGFEGPGSVMQLYDGTRLYVGSGTVSFPYDTWMAESVEVLRGPASVLYGEGAIGGAVNVIPRQPSATFSNEAMISYGSDNTVRGAAGSGGPIGNGDVTYRFDVSSMHSDGWVDRGDNSSLDVSAAVRWQVAQNLVFTVRHDHAYREPMQYWGTPNINGQIGESLRTKNYNVDDSDISLRDDWTAFKTEWAPSDGVTIRNTAYHLSAQRHWKEAEQFTYNGATGQVDRSKYYEIYHNEEQFGDRLDGTVRHNLFGLSNQFSAGFDVNHIDFRYSRVSDTSSVTSVDPYNVNAGYFSDIAGSASPLFRSKLDQYSLFTEDKLDLTDQLALVSGARFDAPSLERTDYSSSSTTSKNYRATTWRIGSVYTPIPDLAFYAQYSSAVDPVSYLLTMTSSNADYKMSTGRQMEVGIKQSLLEGRIDWSAAAYRIVKDNLVTKDANNPTLSVQVGEQSSKGLELAASVRMTNALRVSVNGTILDAQYEDFNESVSGASLSRAGNTPKNIPEQLANLWVDWDFAPQWSSRVGLQYVGKRYVDAANTQELGAYTLVNAGLDYAVTDNVKVRMQGYNLFDKVYGVMSNYSNQQILGRPRSFELSVHATF
ncbi:MAG: TonB-dependent siderophore receptor [Rhodospirillaceae bacterium]|nr:TonB-dependent siderophore receptor [Rhodospirillaceae bacterium]